VLRYNFSLFKKLFIFICILLLLIILPFFYIAKTSLTHFGSYAYTVNEKQIKKMSRFYLSRIVAEQAKNYEAVFEKIKTASSLLGSQLTSVYDNIDVLSKIMPLNKISNLELNPENQIFFSPDSEAVITFYWGGGMISDEIQKELNALSHINPMLMKSKELVDEGLATYVITASGIGQYYTLDLGVKKKAYHLPLASEFDLRQGQPFTIFTSQKIKHFNTQWTEIYKDDIFDGLMMTATTPVYDQKSEFKGIIGIDITVEYIINNLKQGAFSSRDETENILFAFLQNRQGKMIAFPREFFPLFGLDIDMNHCKNSSDILNYSLTDSSIQAVRQAGQGTLNTHSGIIDLVIDNEKYILAIGCLGSIEWHLVLVAREADLMTSVQKTQLALNKSLGTIWKDLVFYSFLIVVVLVLSALCTIRVFISPIKQFIQATQNVSKGDFLSTLKIERNDEIGLLAKSFNLMIEKLRISKNKEKENARELENRIQLRTMELEKSNDELNHIKDELEKIISKRTAQLRRLNEHLVYSEENERKAIASDLHDSVTQTLAASIFKLKNIRESDKGINEKDFSEVQGYLEQSVREIRSLIYQLSPPILDDFDIEIALGFLIEETNLKHKSQFKYINNIEDPVCLDQAIKVTLYRAVNELITNILKHSGTKKGEIEISKIKENIMIQVEDQGAGFDVDIIKDSIVSGFGLHSLIERMENLGGTFLMDSSPGKGTKIILTAPVFLGRDNKYEKN
jgi:signal transduction histidine kinase